MERSCRPGSDVTLPIAGAWRPVRIMLVWLRQTSSTAGLDTAMVIDGKDWCSGRARGCLDNAWSSKAVVIQYAGVLPHPSGNGKPEAIVVHENVVSELEAGPL